MKFATSRSYVMTVTPANRVLRNSEQAVGGEVKIIEDQGTENYCSSQIVMRLESWQELWRI